MKGEIRKVTLRRGGNGKREPARAIAINKVTSHTLKSKLSTNHLITVRFYSPLTIKQFKPSLLIINKLVTLLPRDPPSTFTLISTPPNKCFPR